MKNLFFVLLLFLVGCHYSSNRRINNRVPPVTIIAIDSVCSSIVLRDGENKVFTISSTSTTNAMRSSLVVGDTVRVDGEYVSKIVVGDF
jgi:hypothetical protein